MDRDRPKFDDLMADAHRALLTLDNIAMRGGSKARAIAIRDGLRVYSRLIEFRLTERMDAAESSHLQSAVDFLRARLRFFGEAIQRSSSSMFAPNPFLQGHEGRLSRDPVSAGR